MSNIDPTPTDELQKLRTRSKWPKVIPPLTIEQERISHDFMKYWHEVLPKRYGAIEHFNHTYSVKNSSTSFTRTLEIGAGLGEHIRYEVLTPAQEENYFAMELRDNMARQLSDRFPKVKTIIGDCQRRTDFSDGFFERILAIHVLEHLSDLPSCVRELHRLCDKTNGIVSVVIPCEGSLAYSMARRLSAQRIFEKRYNQPYKWFISREHINVPGEILEELSPYFTIDHRRFFPLPIIPMEFCNLVIGLTLRPT